MDHMRISGIEPSSVILSQTMQFKKLKSDDPNVSKQAEDLLFPGKLRLQTIWNVAQGPGRQGMMKVYGPSVPPRGGGGGRDLPCHPVKYV